ncbi:hypothetical protein IW147_002304 [Coemansia sp. RSA 720]|nr:hypothetical protein IW147_002304 [Coemansia sp. RSA 720]
MEKCSYNDEEAVTVSGGSDEEADTDSGGTNRESTISPINFLGIPVVLDGKVPIRVYTNIKLIETFGLESMVKQLLFREDRSRGIFGLQLESLTSFISIIQTLFSGLPEETNLTEPFTKWHELENAGTVPSNDAQSRCYAASKAAANVLIHKFPNVSSMFAVMTDPHEFLQKLIVELAVGYDKKLTKFVCEIPPMFPYTLSAPNLVELDLKILSSSHQNLPTICPRSLRKINLVVERQPFSWDMFRIDTESKTIAFDNLVGLSILGTIQYPSIDDAVTANNPVLRFPKLERLYLSDCNLTKKDAQAIVGHRLKQLHFGGSFIVASELCKQPLRNLDKLVLVWEESCYPEEAEDFVSMANKIFNKTDGIEYVHCKIYSGYTEIMNDIDWPYLTHLSLGFSMPFNVLFEMHSKVPNLVHLDILIANCSDNELIETTELLTNIKKYYPMPSSSKIETLYLAVYHDEECLESCCPMLFGGAIENLKWYWPQLKDIEFQMI